MAQGTVTVTRGGKHTLHTTACATVNNTHPAAKHAVELDESAERCLASGYYTACGRCAKAQSPAAPKADTVRHYRATWTTPEGRTVEATRSTKRVYTHAAVRGPYSGGGYGVTFHGSAAQAARKNEYGDVAAVVPVTEYLPALEARLGKLFA